MRVIIVEGTLDEVLAVLEKTHQSNDSEGVWPKADEHHDNGAEKHKSDKKDWSPVSPVSLLSYRERSIIVHLMEGHSNKVIALDLKIAEATVKTHVRSILKKIGVMNRTQAAVWGRTNVGVSWFLPTPSSHVLSRPPGVMVSGYHGSS